MLDWSHLQSFVAVAEHRSLTAAAQATGGSQPTLSRHISTLEQEIGERLFERSKGGVELTPRGSELLEHARVMADAASRLEMVSSGVTQDLVGTVRLTASRIVASYILPEILARLHAKYPRIEIELVASDETRNLLRREADIALRMYRPTQEDVIAVHIGDLGLAAYAANSYLDQHGPITGPEEYMQHDVVGYDRSSLIIDGMRAFGANVDREFFKFRSDDQVVCWEMVRAGWGIGFNQMAVGDADDRVQRISGPDPIAHLPMWLTAHPELQASPRIRRVFDFLKTELPKQLRGES